MYRPDVRLIEGWVVIGHDNNTYHFSTFEEAIKGPNGHVMSEQFYKQCYEKGTSHVYES